jgi:hypothetical protein
MTERKKKPSEIVPLRGNIVDANYRIVGRGRASPIEEEKKETRGQKAMTGFESFANWMADRRGWDFSLRGAEVADEHGKKKKSLFDMDLGL